jgi:hypothetical protein
MTVTALNISHLRSVVPPHQGDVRDLLTQLAAEGVAPPPAAARAMTLLAEVLARCFVATPALAERVGTDLDDVDADSLTEAMRRALVDRHLYDSDWPRSALDAHLAAIAVAAIAADVERILADLRPTWDTAAAAVHGAVRAGIGPHTKAADVLEASDAAVAAWRALLVAVPVLDRLHRLRNRVLWTAALDVTDDDLEYGQAAWLTRAAGGPPSLTSSEPKDVAAARRRIAEPINPSSDIEETA